MGELQNVNTYVGTGFESLPERQISKGKYPENSQNAESPRRGSPKRGGGKSER